MRMQYYVILKDAGVGGRQVKLGPFGRPPQFREASMWAAVRGEHGTKYPPSWVPAAFYATSQNGWMTYDEFERKWPDLVSPKSTELAPPAYAELYIEAAVIPEVSEDPAVEACAERLAEELSESLSESLTEALFAGSTQAQAQADEPADVQTPRLVDLSTAKRKLVAVADRVTVVSDYADLPDRTVICLSGSGPIVADLPYAEVLRRLGWAVPGS